MDVHTISAKSTNVHGGGGGTSIWSNVNLRKMGKRGASTPASGRDG